MKICVDVLGRPEVFLTSVALLTAILSVWAQLWVNTYKIYKDNYFNYTVYERRGTEYSTSFWLGWIYLAILASLLAFALGAASYLFRWDWLLKVAISLFGVSLYMTFVQVFQSWFSAFDKFYNRRDFDKPHNIPSHYFLKKLMCKIIVLGAFIFLGIIALLWEVTWLFRTCVGIVLALLIIIGIFIKYRYEENG